MAIRLTESRLRQIIREEASRLNESAFGTHVVISLVNWAPLVMTPGRAATDPVFRDVEAILFHAGNNNARRGDAFEDECAPRLQSLGITDVTWQTKKGQIGPVPLSDAGEALRSFKGLPRGAARKLDYMRKFEPGDY